MGVAQSGCSRNQANSIVSSARVFVAQPWIPEREKTSPIAGYLIPHACPWSFRWSMRESGSKLVLCLYQVSKHFISKKGKKPTI